MIFVTGAAGFVGKHLVARLVAEGKKVRCMVQAPSDILSKMGVELVQGDVMDPVSLARGMSGCDSVIHLVGVWRASPAKYKSLHVQGTSNVAQAAKASGIRRFIYVSAMGVSLGIKIGFYETKAESESSVTEADFDYTIFRPAVIIGPGDEFTTALLDMIRKSPGAVPVLGDGKVRLQPLFVEDLVDCLAKSLDRTQVVKQIYDIAGPDVMTYDEILDALLDAMGVSRIKLHLPLWLVAPCVSFASIFVPNMPITPDEIKILNIDNVRDVSRLVRDFDLKQTRFKAALSQYVRKGA